MTDPAKVVREALDTVARSLAPCRCRVDHMPDCRWKAAVVAIAAAHTALKSLVDERDRAMTAAERALELGDALVAERDALRAKDAERFIPIPFKQAILEWERYKQEYPKVVAERDALRAERERYRDALERLGSIKSFSGAQEWTVMDDLKARCAFARAALLSTPSDTQERCRVADHDGRVCTDLAGHRSGHDWQFCHEAPSDTQEDQ